MNITGRNVLAGISLCFCALAVHFYMNQEDKLSAPETSADNRAKVKLTGFEFFRYQHNDLVERVAGKKAELLDPGKILFSDGVRAVRNKEKRRDELTSEQATVQLKSENGQNILAKSSVQSIHLSKDVELRLGEWRMSTEEANYVEDTGEVSGKLPVRVDSGPQFIAGEGGFEYNLKTESFRMRGGITGSFDPSKAKATDKEPQ